MRAGFAGFAPDACLINRYEPGAKMSLHQDRDEEDFAAPIVSVSLGLPAIFLFGGLKRSDKPQRYRLQHGDVVVWGGPSRLFFHGVAPLADGEHAAARPTAHQPDLSQGALTLYSGSMTTTELKADTAATAANRTGIYLAVLQLVFTLGWTTYVIYLPKLAAEVGIAPSAVILILMLDQAIFTITDTAMGIAADRVAQAGRAAQPVRRRADRDLLRGLRRAAVRGRHRARARRPGSSR